MRAHPRFIGARSAFTLIELLVVIAVVTVLISMLLPAIGRARTVSKGTVCLSGLRSIGQAVALYCDANKDRYPISSHTAGSMASPGAWLTSLQPYGVSPQFRKCPLDPYRAEQSRVTSYATNEHFEPLVAGEDYNPITGQKLPGGRGRAFDRSGLVLRPCATIYVYEPEGAGAIDHLNTHKFATAQDVRAGIAVTRHLGAAHYLFADGHSAPWAWGDFAAKFSPETSPFDPETAR